MQPQNNYPPQQTPDPYQTPQAPQQPVTPPQLTPEPPAGPQPGFTPQPLSPQPSKKPMVLIAIIAAVVIVALGVAAYFLFFNKPANPSAENAAQQSANSANNNAKDLSKMTHVTFTEPADMSAYKSVASSAIPTQKIYSLLGTGTTACSLTFGTATPGQRPGTSIDEIVNVQLDVARRAGATIDGPNTGTALALKDASGAQYTLPTLNYQIDLGNIYETDHFSIVVLSGGERVIVARTCATKGAKSDPAYMNKLDETAKQLVISAS